MQSRAIEICYTSSIRIFALIAAPAEWSVPSKQSVTNSERCANSFVVPHTDLSPLSMKNSALAATSVSIFARGIVLNSRTQRPANTPKVSSASANWLNRKTVSAVSCAKRSVSRTRSASNPPCLWNSLKLKPQTNFNFTLRFDEVGLDIEVPLRISACADVAGYV